MASRNIGGSIQAALKDLFNERAVVEDAIEKLQSLLGNMKASKRRGRPPGPGRKKVLKQVRTPATSRKVAGRGKKKVSKKTGRRAWSSAARQQAAERMRKYWADRNKKGARAKREAAGAKRRGRPATATKATATKATATKATATKKATPAAQRKGWSPEARKAAAERMRQYWAERQTTQQG